jgi:hypothetical protein
MRKTLIIIFLACLSTAFWPNNDAPANPDQATANPIIGRIVAKLDQDKKLTLNLTEYKIRKIYDCVSIDNCSPAPKSVERIRTIYNQDYVVEKDGALIMPPNKLRFDTTGMDGNILQRYDLIETYLLDPASISYNFFPRRNLPKAKSNAEKAAELTSGKLTIDRNDSGIIAMRARLSKPIAFGNFIFIKIFQLFALDSEIRRERVADGYYVTTEATVYTEFKRLLSDKREKHVITLIRNNK